MFQANLLIEIIKNTCIFQFYLEIEMIYNYYLNRLYYEFVFLLILNLFHYFNTEFFWKTSL